ncbi:MAG: hypothetical protein H6708_21750 [Kofleriaceae bacterium]|nr:hypothetical protein [Myxococcales bacterium]MCB9563039.1 hypothetical protein [Kofleriaceae bacterium]
MHRIALVLVVATSLAGCFGLGGQLVKEMASTHVIDTGLHAGEDAIIFRGTERHGCTKVERGAQADNWACPELPAEHPIGCRTEGEKIRCACTGDGDVCTKLITDIVAEGRAP